MRTSRPFTTIKRVPPTMRRVLRSVARPRATLDYASLYDDLADWAISDEDIVGPGDADSVGPLELAVLVAAGLRPSDSLVDFGCGTGRLALYAVPFLEDGEYIGIEISDAILRRAQRNLAEASLETRCRISWLRNTSSRFPLRDATADVMCAFSVFTHMEHEDSYRYLVDALRVVRPGGRFVFSCLPLDLEVARQFFREEAGVSLAERWGRVRTVTTSRDYMSQIAELAGWRVEAWYPGDQMAFAGPGGTPERAAFGQSVCVLERPREDSIALAVVCT